MPPRTHSLSLDVALDKRGAATHQADQQEARHFGYDIGLNYGTVSSLSIAVESTTLRITVRNLGQTPDTAVLECYFIGERTGQPGVTRPSGSDNHPAAKGFVFDRPTQSLTIPAGVTNTTAVQSQEVRTLTYKSSHQAALPSGADRSSGRDENGTKPLGWLVRLTVDGKTIAVRASNNAYEDLTKDEAKFTDFLNQNPPLEDSRRKTIGPFRSKGK